MAVEPPPQRFWRGDGTEPLPSPAEALVLPLEAFPGWYLRMECGACGQERYLSQSELVRAGKGGEVTRDFIARLRHTGCGGRLQICRVGYQRAGCRQDGAPDRAPARVGLPDV